MTKTVFAGVALAAAAIFSACTPPATNAPANTNTNTNAAKPTAAAPTADAFMAMEQKANDAYVKADTAHFQTILSDKATMSWEGKVQDKAAIVADIGKVKCEGNVVKLSEPQIAKIDNDTYAFTYKNESTGKCDHGDGKMIDSMPMRASTVWVRSGDTWKAAWHGETMIVDPKNPPAAPKADATAKDATKPAEKKADDKAAPATNTAADTKPAAPKPSANTEALTKLHLAGWEAFKAKDAKYFESTLTSGFAFVAPDGSYMATKADAIKEWTGGGKMKCEGITKVSFTDGFAVAISPTVELLLGKGSADGTCDGVKNGALWTAAVYVKEGDAWKIAYMMETPPMPGM